MMERSREMLHEAISAEAEDNQRLRQEIADLKAQLAEKVKDIEAVTFQRDATEKRLQDTLKDKKIIAASLKDAREALEEIARYDSSEGYIAMRASPDYDGQKPESLTERMERVVKEHPLSSNYEDDARTIWPKRWAALERKKT